MLTRGVIQGLSLHRHTGESLHICVVYVDRSQVAEGLPSSGVVPDPKNSSMVFRAWLGSNNKSDKGYGTVSDGKILQCLVVRCSKPI